MSLLRAALRVACRRLMLSADGMVPEGVDDAKRLQIERQMLDALVHGMRQVLLTSIIIGPALTAWLTWPHIGAVRALVPMLALMAFGVERVFLLRRIARARALRDDEPRRWAAALRWRWILGCVVVLLWFHFAIESGNAVLISEMLALLTILAAGGAALFASWPPVMWTVVSALLLGMALQLALVGGTERAVEAVFCAVLWLVLVSANLRAARTLHSEALAHLRNQDLVRELRDKHAQAQAANAAKSRFFAAVNHDLRQPLQAMGLYLSTLGPHAGASAQDATTLARMRECMGALDQMLLSLLDYSRMESGALVADLRAFALAPLFQHLADVHGGAARQKGVRLQVRSTALWAYSDPALLERALANLLTNALRYTEHGSVVLAARAHGNSVRVRVGDSGLGIPRHAHESIYEEFVQLHNPARDPERGYGLGLATVRHIAILLGASLHLRSRVGRGSIFTLDLPAAGPLSAAAVLPIVPTAEKLVGRVLVVEDHALARDALVQRLRSWGLQVDAVADGATACAALARAPFDVVLSDWRLPGTIDGLAVLRAARAAPTGLRLGVLVTGEEADHLQALAPEFPVLRKPLRPLRLRTLLVRHLRAGGPAPESGVPTSGEVAQP